MSEWQPIETAPKDGTQLLLCNRQSHFVGKWDAEMDWRVGIKAVDDLGRLISSIYIFVDPTHWMHLPEPPK